MDNEAIIDYPDPTIGFWSSVIASSSVWTTCFLCPRALWIPRDVALLCSASVISKAIINPFILSLVCLFPVVAGRPLSRRRRWLIWLALLRTEHFAAPTSMDVAQPATTAAGYAKWYAT